MSERSPRLRALRPRPQQQHQQAKSETSPRRAEVKKKDVKDEEEVTEETTSRRHKDQNAEITSDNEQNPGESPRKLSKKDNKGIVEGDSLGDDKQYECKICKPCKKYTTLKLYMQHFKTEHDSNKKTKEEGKEGQQKSQLRGKFFRCVKCNYITNVRARFTKHVKYHSMPMIKCDTCDFRTPYKWNLDRHTRNHGGGGAFQCQVCNFTADIRQSLTVHETNHHEPPVGVTNRKPNPFERKPRNCPKRYNQVGASDYRELPIKSNENVSPSKTVLSPSSHSMESVPVNEEANNAAEAECIALKCDEKGCQFITAWDSEMQRHLSECHSSGCSANKQKKPLPMLIPLSPANATKTSNLSSSGSPTTLLKVPRVRVRPELAQIARDNELAKLQANKIAEVKRDLGNNSSLSFRPIDSFERKNASFFDKLKERLSSTTVSNVIPEIAVTTISDLKCWCTFEASNLEELNQHKKTHHTALSVSLGNSRCPKCRRRCKSSSDLETHMRLFHPPENNQNNSTENLENNETNSDQHSSSFRGEYAFPAQMDWDSNYGEINSCGNSVENVSANSSRRRVFKCPHCPFWASTASRFHVHIVGHLNRKPFECSLCAYRSNWRWDITKHIKLKAARDPAHVSARVLMTDETGRRNYSKYNKYLTQVGANNLGDQGVDELNVEEEDRLSKVIITNPKNYLQPPELTPAPTAVLNADANVGGSSNVPLRPPPPLKAANRNQGFSLLRKNSASPTIFARSITPVSVSSGMDEPKRTAWKCKRCNFKDSDRSVVLQHVKINHGPSSDLQSDEKNPYGCGDCPFSAPDSSTLALHRIHHRPNLEAIFKCYFCPYYVTTKAELLDHSRLHGEDLANVHQNNTESESYSVNSARKQLHQNLDNASRSSKDDSFQERNLQSPSTSTASGASLYKNPEVPSLLLDTRELPDAPLVWVSRPDGVIAKMLKCRHCPYVSQRRAEVLDHETMHANSSLPGPFIECPHCSFSCTRNDIMESHSDMHKGCLGTVHCLVDDSRPDSQQLNDLATLLGLSKPPSMGAEPDLQDSRLVHCCSKCPARFLCEKELRIHFRYHSTELAFNCQWCSYAARQPAHLLSHQKAHAPEYQERTRYLLSIYGHSQRHPPPTTACIEAGGQESADGNSQRVAWIVVEVPATSEQNFGNNMINNGPRPGNQVFTCGKCPARYFKLDALEYHMTLHGSNNRFKCTECDYSSKTAQNLVKHQVVHRRHTEATNASNATATARVSQTEPQFALFMRGNPNFVYPGYIRNGRLKEKRYKCHKCPSAFEKREQYRVHLGLHGARQRYCCTVCDYSVKYYANYVQHLKKHEANDIAQAERRQGETESIPIENETDEGMYSGRCGKSLKKTGISSPINSQVAPPQTSNQDKQSVMLMQRRAAMKAAIESEPKFRCQSCPFSSNDKDIMDAHRRRHGIERMTPSCPHCDYVPKKEENIAEHIKLHFTRMFKPESYLFVELLSLSVQKVNDGKKKGVDKDIIFQECPDGKYLPPIDISVCSPNPNGTQEKIIVDPHTGEVKPQHNV